MRFPYVGSILVGNICSQIPNWIPARSKSNITMFFRFAVSESAVRVHIIRPTGVEGKNGDGCPLARWVCTQ